MISDADLVDVIAALYAPPNGYFETIQTINGVTWGIRRAAADAQLVVCRGSVTIEDWLRDFESEAARVIPGYPSIGHIPYGFGAGIIDAYKAIQEKLVIDADTYFLGHSLGAAHAAIIAGMYAADCHGTHGITRIVLCGCPKPGMLPLATLLSGGSIGNYRNGSDPVPDVPIFLPPLLPWQALTEMKALNAPPPDPEIAVDWHHISLYAKGIHAL